MRAHAHARSVAIVHACILAKAGFFRDRSADAVRPRPAEASSCSRRFAFCSSLSSCDPAFLSLPSPSLRSFRSLSVIFA